jgi:hypothetical protein
MAASAMRKMRVPSGADIQQRLGALNVRNYNLFNFP